MPYVNGKSYPYTAKGKAAAKKAKAKKKATSSKAATTAKAKKYPKAKMKKTVSNPKLRRLKRQGNID
jgi:DNA-binding PadR family transcriptional regulator